MFMKLPALITFLLLTPFRTEAQRVIRVEIQGQASYSTIGTKFPSYYISPGLKGSANPGFNVLGYYHLNKNYGFLTGVGMGFFTTAYRVDSIHESFSSTDSENTPYIRNVYGSQISEKTTLIFLNVPVKFFYSYPVKQNISLVATLGPEVSIPVKTEVTGTGLFTYTGRYPGLDNVVLKDIPPYGFNSNVPVAVKQRLRPNKIIICVSASAGLNISFSRKVAFHTSISFKRSMTSMLPKTSRNNYHLSDDAGSFRSMTGLDKGIINNFMINAGIQKIIMY